MYKFIILCILMLKSYLKLHYNKVALKKYPTRDFKSTRCQMYINMQKRVNCIYFSDKWSYAINRNPLYLQYLRTPNLVYGYI